MSHLRRLGSQISVSFPPDDEGYIGRECPKAECLGYFKITPGTGLHGTVPCHCPYCGNTAGHEQFLTQAQAEYATSVAFNKITKAMIHDLKALEFNRRPAKGIGISMTVKGQPTPIRFYREEQLETNTACDQCTLRYAIYGLFAYCPDCKAHNSLQILQKNLELAAKELALAASLDRDLREHLIGDALENAVSAFDGFGRETCRVHASAASSPAQAENISFQNLNGARPRIQNLFELDLTTCVTADEWEFATRCFQKRHLLAHKMGIVDAAYLKATSDRSSVAGRKVSITADEVQDLLTILTKLGTFLVNHL